MPTDIHTTLIQKNWSLAIWLPWRPVWWVMVVVRERGEWVEQEERGCVWGVETPSPCGPWSPRKASWLAAGLAEFWLVDPSGGSAGTWAVGSLVDRLLSLPPPLWAKGRVGKQLGWKKTQPVIPLECSEQTPYINENPFRMGPKLQNRFY